MLKPVRAPVGNLDRLVPAFLLVPQVPETGVEGLSDLEDVSVINEAFVDEAVIPDNHV